MQLSLGSLWKGRQEVVEEQPKRKVGRPRKEGQVMGEVGEPPGDRRKPGRPLRSGLRWMSS